MAWAYENKLILMLLSFHNNQNLIPKFDLKKDEAAPQSLIKVDQVLNLIDLNKINYLLDIKKAKYDSQLDDNMKLLEKFLSHKKFN